MSAEVVPEFASSVMRHVDPHHRPAADRPTTRVPDRPHGHVIVCGLGGIGMRIAEQLRRAGEPVTVLEEYADRTQLEVVAGWGASTSASYGTSSATLIAAGIHSARAVVCVVEDELKNLEIALVARELRPDVRVVTQLGNHAIGRAMARGNGPGAVLDVASLAAPAIVEACLRRRIHEVPIGDETFLVATLPVPRTSSLRALYGDLAPIAVVRRSADEQDPILICPDRDLVVGEGDVAAVLGTAEDFRSHNVDLADHADLPDTPHRRHPGARLMAVLSGLMKDFDPVFYKAVTAVLGLLSVSTLLLWLTYDRPGMSMLDALYFSTETVATVGYGDFNFIDQSPWLRLWAIFLMAAGVTTIAMMMAFLSDMLISRRLNDSTGRRRARGMSRHVVVIGLGAFGIRVASALIAAGKRVVIVERDRENRFLAEAQDRKVPVIFGDATQRSTLNAARLQQSSAVAIMTSNDMVNIETAIAVHDLIGSPMAQFASVPVVTRVFDRALGRTTARRFGFDNVQSTEELTAPWFVGAALGLDVLGSFSIAQRTFMVSRLTIEPGSRLAGLTMDQLSANTRVVALTRHSTGVMEHPLHRTTHFESGDLAYLIGPYAELLGVLRQARLR